MPKNKTIGLKLFNKIFHIYTALSHSKLTIHIVRKIRCQYWQFLKLKIDKFCQSWLLLRLAFLPMLKFENCQNLPNFLPALSKKPMLVKNDEIWQYYQWNFFIISSGGNIILVSTYLKFCVTHNWGLRPWIVILILALLIAVSSLTWQGLWSLLTDIWTIIQAFAVLSKIKA